MGSICFVTNELGPVTRGGIGSLIWDALHVLLADGHAVAVVADIEDEPLQRFRAEHAPTLPNAKRLAVHSLRALAGAHLAEEHEFGTIDLFRSYLAKEALVELERQGQRFDLVEFMDVYGPAYCSLVEKALGRHFQDTLLVVRNHGTLEHWHAFEAFPFLSLRMMVIMRLEQYCMRQADLVLCASPTWAQACRQRYHLPEDKVLVSPPSLVASDLPVREQGGARRNVILCHGKLEQRKGVEILVDAAVRLFCNGEAPSDLEVVFTGGDNEMAPEPGSYTAYLERRIPRHLRRRFKFTGHVPRKTLGGLFARTLFAVIPSRVESYCYAAHEVYQAGIPLIVSDIPAFADAFHHERNCLKFDGTPTDLCRQMQRLLGDEALRESLARPYPLEEHDLGTAYRMEHTPAPRPSPQPPPGPVTVFVLSHPEAEGAEERTLASLAADGTAKQVWLLRPWSHTRRKAPLWLRGQAWVTMDEQGQAFPPGEVLLGAATLMLQAGDTIDARLLPLATAALAAQPQLAMVACWHQGEAPWGESPLCALVQRFPWELIGELAPLLRGKLASRAVFRTTPGTTVDQWVDDRLGPFADLALAWRALEAGQAVLTIPEPWVRCGEEDPGALRLTLEEVGRITPLFDRERNAWMHPQLMRLANLALQGNVATQGPVLIERLRMLPGAWQITKPPPPPPVVRQPVEYYGKKWLVAQLLRELFRSPLPGFLRRLRPPKPARGEPDPFGYNPDSRG